MASLENVIENGPLKIAKDPVTPEDIVYVSSLCALAFFGTFGNILILIMFSTKELSRTSYSIYIRAAAVSDTIFMLMNISEDVIDHLTSYSLEQFFSTSHQFCIFWFVIKGTFLAASPWIVVALALDRCVAIWNPLHRTRYCTKKTAAIVTASIVLASFGVELGLNLPFKTMVIGPAMFMICEDTGMNDEMLIIKRLVTETGLPCITMLIPNLLVIFKIQKSLSFRRTFTNDQREKVAKSARPLLVVSCLAFITLLPISITELVEFIKMNNAAVVDYPNPGNDYDHYPNRGNDYDHYPYRGNDYDDYQYLANRNTSFNRTFDDDVFNFSNQTFENITTMRFFDEKDESISTDPIKSTNLGNDDVRNANSDLIESTSLGTDDERNANSDPIESTRLGTDDVRNYSSDLIESTSLGTEHERNSSSDLIESTSLGTDDERNANSDLIESTSLGTDDEKNANSDLIESTSLGTDDERNANSDLIESTSLGTDDERNANSDLIESTRNESGNGQHDGMNSDDLENQQENGENQNSEREHLRNETVEEEQDILDDETYKLIDTIWRTCNFIYMCNFAQNFYLLILSSSTYRNAIIKMVSCKCRKKKRDTPHVNRVIQQPVLQTISHPSTAETASTSLEAVNLNV